MTSNGHQRKDPERHAAQVRARNRAFYKAVQQLIAEKQDEYDKIYARCAAAEGVTPQSRTVKVEQIEAEIERLQRQLKRAQSDVA